MLRFFTEDEAYMPRGHFSKDEFLGTVEAMGKQAVAEGYERAWLLGESTFVIRRSVDVKAWFAAESWATEAETRYLHLILCLYNLDLFDGEMVMYVLQTHPQIFVNGLVITNPHYIPAREFLASL
jgi:hypothetical protein